MTSNVPHSGTFAWKIPWTEEPGGLQSMGREESDTTEWLPFPFSLSCIGEGNGKPLQCSCLENPRDGGAWWAAIYGVAQSWTQLKQLSSSSSMLCCFSYVWLFANLWTIAHQVSLSIGFFRQECWSGLPCPPPRDLPDSRIKPTSQVFHIGRHILYHWPHLGSPVLDYKPKYKINIHESILI